MAQQTQSSDSDTTLHVTPRKRKRERPQQRPIAGMRPGWYYRPTDRAILHGAGESLPLVIGTVPRILGRIAHLTDDGQYVKTEYLVVGHRQRRPRILSEDELDRGTWAAKCGMRRPTGGDERHAFARIIREEAEVEDEIPARTYYTETGDLILPDADAQTLGYRTLRGDEHDAREAWEEIGAWASMDGKAALILGGFFVGPVLDSLDVLAHMISLHGPGQQGKSTMLVTAAACLGDLKPKGQQLMLTWNSSKQGITQSLRTRGYLPLALDEHSSSGRTIKDSSRDISQMVAGAMRAMGTADGSPREADGFWHSVLLSSSNERLKFTGQSEDLATRLQEFEAPFFPDRWVAPDGAPASSTDQRAEHISQRLKRLARGYGGWPIEWAVRMGMFRADNLAQLKKLHLELCAKYRPAQGGIANTIAELHMAWVVGVHMFGAAIGVPTLGAVAEAEASARLAEAVQDAAEANVPDCERLWGALDAQRIDAAAFPEMGRLLYQEDDLRRPPRGFIRTEEGEWWVVDPVVRQAASDAGVDNVTSALRALADLGVHIRGAGKNAQRKLPRPIQSAGLGIRMHCFNTRRASDLFVGADEDPEPEFPGGTTPRDDPGRPGVVPENSPPTCTGTTGTTGTTSPLVLFNQQEETGGAVLAPVPSPRGPEIAPEPPAREWPDLVEEVSDAAWAKLAAKAQGRTHSAVRIGVLGDGALHLPNHRPVSVPMPAGVDATLALMRHYELRTLYLHESALTPLGLPTYDDRQERLSAAGHAGGPQAGDRHPWAPADGALAYPEGGGLSSWMTLRVEGEAGEWTVAIPAYENRMDRSDVDGRGGFGGAPTPAVLLDALMIYLLSTQHGTAEWPKVVPYYRSPNKTGEDYAGSRARTEVLCEAVRHKPGSKGDPAVPFRTPSMIAPIWHRDPADLSEAELGAEWLVQFDKSAAYLPSFNGLLGVGEPEHASDGIAWDRKLAGWWRVETVPGFGDPRLPTLKITEADEGGHWLSTPDLDLLCELYPEWTPTVVEAWYWPRTERALSGLYDRLRLSRLHILRTHAEGRPGAVWAKHVNGAIYKSFRGYLGRNWERVQKDNNDDDRAYDGDVFWRPDWAKMILCAAMANTYRNLAKYAATSGRYPLSLDTDAATWAADTNDPQLSKPEGMRLGTGGGQWTPEGSAPMNRVREALGAGEHAGQVIRTLTEGEGD